MVKHQTSHIHLVVPFLRWSYPEPHSDFEVDYFGQKFLPELLYAAVLLLSLHVWPKSIHSASEIIIFIIWALIGFLLFSLALTNSKTMLLPNKLVYPLGVTIIVYQLVSSITSGSGSVLVSALVGGLILGGIPYLLFQLSAGRWIGGGDVKLGFFAGILLGWKLALLVAVVAPIAFWVCYSLFKQFSKSRPQATFPSGVLWAAIVIVCVLFGHNLVS